MTNQDLIEMIPVYQTGQRVGRPRTENLRELHRLLLQYKFNEAELELLRKEILENTWTRPRE